MDILDKAVRISIRDDTYVFEYEGAKASVCDLKDGRCLIGDVECDGDGVSLLRVIRSVRTLVEDRGFSPVVSVDADSPHLPKLRKIYAKLGLKKTYEVYTNGQDSTVQGDR